MPLDVSADLTARDTSLTGLSTLFDPRLFAERLQSKDPRLNVQQLDIRYVRYKPSRRCLVAYSGRIDGQAVDFYAKALTIAGWEKRGQRHCDHAKLKSAQADFPHLALALPAVRVLIFPPHYDNFLPVYGRLADAEGMRELVTQSLGNLAPGEALQLDHLVHKPERRFVGRLHNSKFSAAIKCYTSDGYVAARRNAKTMRSGKLFRTPEAIGRSRRHHFMILPWVHGRLLRDAMWQRTASAMDIERTGGALAEFHGQRGRKLGQLEPEAEALRLIAAGDDVGFLLPQLAHRISAVANWTAAQISEMATYRNATHGDFYSKQVIVTDDTIGVLDLDEAHLGDPLADLANFLAHVETYVLRGRIDRSTADSVAAALIEGYQHVAGVIDTLRLRTRVVAALLRLTHAPFRNGETDWPQRIEATVERAEQLAAELRGPTSSSGTAADPHSAMATLAHTTISDPFHIDQDEAFAFLNGAFEMRIAEREIRKSLNTETSQDKWWRLAKADIVRYKQGRRCLVQYELIRAGGDEPLVCLGKVRAKGLDRATYELHRQLHDAGLDASANVSVPEPLGCISRWRMWLQRKTRARALDAKQIQAGGAELGRRIVAAVSKLHQAGVPSRRRHAVDRELEILRQRFDGLARDRPELSARLRRLRAGCETVAADLIHAPECGIHRDFYQDHVLIAGERIVLVDLDLYCLGDPALDVGNFVGHLMELGLRTTGSPRAFGETAWAMLDHFGKLSGSSARQRAQIYTTLTLARHVELCRHYTGRRHLLTPLLELCEERVSHAGPIGV